MCVRCAYISNSRGLIDPSLSMSMASRRSRSISSLIASSLRQNLVALLFSLEKTSISTQIIGRPETHSKRHNTYDNRRTLRQPGMNSSMSMLPSPSMSNCLNSAFQFSPVPKPVSSQRLSFQGSDGHSTTSQGMGPKAPMHGPKGLLAPQGAGCAPFQNTFLTVQKIRGGKELPPCLHHRRITARFRLAESARDPVFDCHLRLVSHCLTRDFDDRACPCERMHERASERASECMNMLCIRACMHACGRACGRVCTDDRTKQSEAKYK